MIDDVDDQTSELGAFQTDKIQYVLSIASFQIILVESKQVKTSFGFWV